VSFTLDPRPPVPDALREVALERLDRVLRELAGTRSKDPATAIHEARKDLKRLRSLVRLLRPGLGRKAYRREADALRRASRALGALREADALVETVEALRGPASGRVPATTLDAVHDALAAGGSTARQGSGRSTDGEAPGERVPEGRPGVAEATAILLGVRERIAEGALDVDGRSTFADGLSRTYERAHAAFAVADADPTTTNLHDWRKRAKDLRYQQALLAPVWPVVLRAQAAEAKALSETLGDDHDLAELALVLRDPSGALSGVPHDVDALLPVLDARRASLLRDARARGARLHAERPKAFRRRIRRYVDAPPLHD
jgi:CHAD domain-containing protein